MHIFVKNLSFDATPADVEKLFAPFGEVESVTIKKKTPGQAFLRMPDPESGHRAIVALNGQLFMGRTIEVEIRKFKRELKANAPTVTEKPAHSRGVRRAKKYLP
jgi:RNA recognition motif-containing protein